MKYVLEGLRFHRKELETIAPLNKSVSGKLIYSDKKLTFKRTRLSPKEYKNTTFTSPLPAR